jgi:hypothetical protein
MKKVILALAFSSATLLASETTVNATMQLMKKGMEDIQNGFLYSNNDMLRSGIETLENSNKTFQNVDVTEFIPNNNKVQVTRNINNSMSNNLDALNKAIASKNLTTATESYGKVMHNCVSCHAIVRGW